jgi:hypothetical protein|tara:strand:- start:22 stop:252 length:231 start_codon:yes stop_codon:yes gene_type:complete
MSKKQKEKTVITVNDVEHIYEDMTDEQKTLINHVNDLDRKIGTSQFNLDQLMFGKSAFVNALSASLESAVEEAEVA